MSSLTFKRFFFKGKIFYFSTLSVILHASQVAQWQRLHLSMQGMQETWVQSLGWKDPLEEEMASYSSILVWEIPRTEQSGGLKSMGFERVKYD